MQQDSDNHVEEAIQTTRLPVAVRWLRDAIAILLWFAILTQLFIFDLGSWIAEQVLISVFLFRYRFFILLGVVALLWLVLGNRRFLPSFGYIAAYPFVVTVWIIPRFILRNWAVAIAFSPAIHSILSRLRASFILFSMAIVSTFVICLVTNRALVVVCMGLLAVYLVTHYFRRFRMAFSPSTVFADVGTIVGKAWEKLRESIPARPEGVDQESQEYKQKLGQNLLSIYMITTVLHYLGERLREAVNSRKLDLYFVGSLMYTFFLTVVVFGIEYFGLERLAPGSFTGIEKPSIFDFLGLSFSTLMTSDISPMKPASGIAQVASYVQLFGSLLIIVLLVFIILTSIRERYRQDLDGVVNELWSASERVGGLLEANYELTVAGAEAWLLEFNPTATPTKWLRKLR
jgi:hypothetical protein